MQRGTVSIEWDWVTADAEALPCKNLSALHSYTFKIAADTCVMQLAGTPVYLIHAGVDQSMMRASM